MVRPGPKTPCRRGAFTLIELLVVIAILVMMIAIVALFAPRLSEKQKPAKGADQFQGWLLIAKQRAKRDGFPRGIRLNVNTTTGFVRDMSYIEQLPDLRGGIAQGTPGTAGMTFLPVNPPLPTNPPPPFDGRPDLTGGSPTVADWTVQPGDLLEVLGQSGQQLYPILSASPAGGSNVLGSVTLGMTLLPLPGVDTAITGAVAAGPNAVVPVPPNVAASITAGATLILDDNLNMTPNAETAVVASVDSTANTVTFSQLSYPHVKGATIRSYHYPYQTMNYRIIRQPRLLEGEQPLALPQDVVLDTSLTLTQLQQFGYSLKFNPVTNPVFDPTFDLLFDPSGALLLRNGAGSNKVILWMRDATRDWPSGNLLPDGDQILVAVYTRTGFIASHPPDTSAAPGSYFSYFQDGRTSGL